MIAAEVIYLQEAMIPPILAIDASIRRGNADAVICVIGSLLLSVIDRLEATQVKAFAERVEEEYVSIGGPKNQKDATHLLYYDFVRKAAMRLEKEKKK